MGSPKPHRPASRVPFEAGVERAIAASKANRTPLLVTGPVGTGKTLILGEIEETIRMRPRHNLNSTFSHRIWLDDLTAWTTADDFIADVHEGWNRARQYHDFTELYSAEGLGVRVSHLFLDDLGAEGDRDGNVEIISRLIVRRYAVGHPTWASSNLSIEDLTKRYTERIVSRLLHAGVDLDVQGSDRRLA